MFAVGQIDRSHGVRRSIAFAHHKGAHRCGQQIRGDGPICEPGARRRFDGSGSDAGEDGRGLHRHLGPCSRIAGVLEFVRSVQSSDGVDLEPHPQRLFGFGGSVGVGGSQPTSVRPERNGVVVDTEGPLHPAFRSRDRYGHGCRSRLRVLVGGRRSDEVRAGRKVAAAEARPASQRSFEVGRPNERRGDIAILRIVGAAYEVNGRATEEARPIEWLRDRNFGGTRGGAKGVGVDNAFGHRMESEFQAGSAGSDEHRAVVHGVKVLATRNHGPKRVERLAAETGDEIWEATDDESLVVVIVATEYRTAPHSSYGHCISAMDPCERPEEYGG